MRSYDEYCAVARSLDVVGHPGFVVAERPRVPRGEHGVERRMGARIGLECPQPALEIGDG